MYLPRASRSGVLSNLRLVEGRTRGPMIGRQPIVSVMPSASITATMRMVYAANLKNRRNVALLDAMKNNCGYFHQNRIDVNLEASRDYSERWLERSGV
jgi:hypothetical protein